MSLPPLKIRIHGDPCLRKKSVPVKTIGSSERMVIDAMIETMYQAKGVGLSAPQVGINQRFFVLDVGDGPFVFINPEITRRNGSCVVEEGCLSVPEVIIKVTRPEEITVCYTDENNDSQTVACDGLMARAIQHEIDHLEGKLIGDYASEEEKIQFKEELEGLEKERKE